MKLATLLLPHCTTHRPIIVKPVRPAVPVQGHGFVLLLTNVAGDVLIEYTPNANIRIRQMQSHEVQIDQVRQPIHYSVSARAIVDDLHSIFQRHRIYHDANWFALDWTEANQTLDALISGSHDARVGRVRRSA